MTSAPLHALKRVVRRQAPDMGTLDGAVARRINPAIVRAYDLRGAVGSQLRSDDAYQLGLAYATYARQRERLRVAVGRDGRLSSLELEHALLEGLIAGGLEVHHIGLGPTPRIHFAVHAYGLDGGIMVTGSHNPGDENGFKLLLGRHPIHGAALRELVGTQVTLAQGGKLLERPISEAYVAALMAQARMKPMTVVWDCGNGAVGSVIGRLTAGMPGRHILLNAGVDGRFPSHSPDPSVAANLRELQAAVRSHQADLGLAFDGDGDRIGLVDATGEIIWPDQLLLFLAARVLADSPNAAVVADVKSSRVLFDGVARLGGRPVMSPTGYVLVREAMLRERAPLAGEMSGHILFSDCWLGTDDALFVAIRLLNALERGGDTLTAFRASLPPTAASPELRIGCPDDRKAQVVGQVAENLARAGVAVDTTDGVRVTTPEGWWLLRASGTEPKLTVRCEAENQAGLEKLLAEVRARIRDCGVDCRD